MKQLLLRTASVCALVVAMGGAAFAQTGGSGGGGSSGGTASPGGSSTTPQSQQKSPGQAEREPGTSQGSGETTRPKGGSAQGPSDRQPNATQRSDDRATPRKQDRSDSSDGKQRTPQASGERKDDGKRASDRARDKDDGKRASDRGRDKDDGKRASDRGKDKDDGKRASDRSKDRDKERTRAGQDKREQGDRSRQGQADRDRNKDGDARRDRADRDRDGATRLSEKQRTTVRERFSRSGIDRNRETNVNFDIRVGASVPRSITLHTLPPDVIEVVPEYRSYRYVYVRDEIVIVDPSSYDVVAVISSSGNRTAGRGRNIVLAPADRVYVREHVDTSASIRLGIGGLSIGMDVPQGVGLQPLPTVVVDRYPDLRGHRYFVYEDDIAIVDPSSDEVVLVIQD